MIVHIGFIIGIIISVLLIISGVTLLMQAKKKNLRSKWGIWLIVVAVVALISAVINYNINY